MACRMFGTNAISKPMLTYHQSQPKEQTSIKNYRHQPTFNDDLMLSFCNLPPFCPGGRWAHTGRLSQWTSCQMRKIACYACARNAGNVFPPPNSKETASQRYRHASRHVRDARVVTHVGIANPQWLGKHPRCMRNPQCYVSGKRPISWRGKGSNLE